MGLAVSSAGALENTRQRAAKKGEEFVKILEIGP